MTALLENGIEEKVVQRGMPSAAMYVSTSLGQWITNEPARGGGSYLRYLCTVRVLNSSTLASAFSTVSRSNASSAVLREMLIILTPRCSAISLNTE